MEGAREPAGKECVVVQGLAAEDTGEQGVVAGGSMLHLVGCFNRLDCRTAPPDGHLKGLQGSPSLAPDAVSCEEKLAESISEPEDRHQKRPGTPAAGGIGVGGLLMGDETAAQEPAAPEEADEDCGRERLKRHRVAMSGQVWIPESWDQEKLLKDWIDCAAIDRSMVPSGLLSAQRALVEDWRRSNSGSRFRLNNRGRCLST